MSTSTTMPADLLVDRLTGRAASVFTPPEDVVTLETFQSDIDAVLDHDYGTAS